MVYPNIETFSFIVGVVIPLLVGLLAKATAPPWVKAVLNAGLSAVAGALTTVINAGTPFHFRWQTFVSAIATTWVISVATYYGLWKPTGVAPAVSGATAGFGVGPAEPAPAPAARRRRTTAAKKAASS